MGDLLNDVIRESHRSLAERLESSSAALRGDATCGEVRQRTDAFLIEMCRHVSAVCDVVLPAVRERVPNGARRVRSYVEQVKRFERSAARTKGRLYGASRDAHVPWERVWVELGTEFDRMVAVEADLIAALVKLYRDNAATLTPDPLHSMFHDSHPPARLRIARLAGL